MKTAVVFYTLDGSTRVAAKLLAEQLSADIYELEEVKPRAKTKGAFMGEAFSAVFGVKSRLKNTFTTQMGGYDRICIGTPIWGSHPTPAFNTFAHMLKPKGRMILLFTVQADGNPDVTPLKAIDKLCVKLSKKGAAAVRVLKLHGAAPGETASKDDMKKQLYEKLESSLKNG